MKKFVIITNLYKDPGLEISGQIEAHIRENGGEAINLHSFTPEVERFEELDYSKIPTDTECIIVLGGDGTMIRVVRKTRMLDIPVIGVNLGTLGYLCELDRENIIQAIDKMLEDQHIVEKRLMIKGYRKNETNGRTALNDIVVHATGVLALIRLNIYVNGQFLATYDGDGVIISTPTGSTGYNLSAGGPIIEPGANVLTLTPINAHNLNSKGIVLRGEDTIEVELVPRRSNKEDTVNVSCDGDYFATLAAGERFVIQRAVHTIKICKVNKQSFLETMRKKMK